MDLFGNTTFEEFLEKLQNLIDCLIVSNELPARGLVLDANIGTGVKTNTLGKIVSYTVFFNEPPYPATDDELLDKNRAKNPIFTFQAGEAFVEKGLFESSFQTAFYKLFPLPVGTELKPMNAQEEKTGKQKIQVAMNSPSLLDWLKRIIQWRIDNYISSADSFGCCSEFVKCSDAKKCVHSNRLYSTVCAYRHNLESGRIFYGKNRNVD